MRHFLPFGLAFLMGGCNVPWTEPAGALLAVNVAAIPVLHRTFFDAAWSVVSGQDCSLVRLDRGQTYCRPPEPPPEAPRYCTRSLGQVDCWLRPPVPWQREVADGPRTLTPLQEEDRTRRWPPL